MKLSKKITPFLLLLFLATPITSISDYPVISPFEKIYSNPNFEKISLNMGLVIFEFPCPSEVEEPEGLAYGQGYLWFASQTQGIYQFLPTDGSLVNWIPMPSDCIEFHGLTHDGDYLWGAAYDNNIYQIAPSDGSAIRSFPAPGDYHIEGLAWGDNHLWLSRRDRKIYKIDPSSGAVVASIPTGSLGPQDLAYGDGVLWDGGDDNIVYQLDPQTGSIISSFDGPGFDICGLAWDGANLWACSQIDKMIYKISIQTAPEVWVDNDYCKGCPNGGHIWGYDAFDNIQDGIDALSSWGVVHVASGTYYENIDFNGKSIAVISESGPTETKINGTGTGDVVTGSATSTIQGFTITGSGNSWYDSGINASFSEDMTICSNIITGNWLGIATNNYHKNLIYNNVICHNTHYGISAQYYSAPIILNNTIVFNGEYGFASYSAKGIVMNNIISFNGIHGIYCSLPESSPEISYNDVYGNHLSDYRGCAPGKGDISADPLFIDPTNENYHLSDSSPCIGAGIITLDLPHIDIEGNPRPNPTNSYPDIGAYEHPDFLYLFYYLTLISGKGGTITPLPGKYEFDEGTKVIITAIPEIEYRFRHWSGDVKGNENPKTITIDANKSVKANFVRQHAVTISCGTGGTTDPAPGMYAYDEGTEISVAGIPEPGYRFSHWSGDISTLENPINIPMNSDKYIEANFIRQHTLILHSGIGGTTDPSPGTHLFDEGMEAILTAIPYPHFEFSHWSGDISGSANFVAGKNLFKDSKKRQRKISIFEAIRRVPSLTGNFSGTDNPIKLFIDSDKSLTANFIRMIYSPLNFRGQKVTNRSLTLAEYINVLKWQVNPDNVNIMKYRIYQLEGESKTMLTEVNADTFEFWHRKVAKDKSYTYSISAVNGENREGDQSQVIIR